jgi:hypothetical protein
MAPVYQTPVWMGRGGIFPSDGAACSIVAVVTRYSAVILKSMQVGAQAAPEEQ